MFGEHLHALARVNRPDEDADVSLAVALSLSLAQQEAAGASARATDARELGQTRQSAIEDADARQLKAAIAASLAAHAGGAAGHAAPDHMPSASEGGVVEAGVATSYNGSDRQQRPSAPSPPPQPSPPPPPSHEVVVHLHPEPVRLRPPDRA